MPESLNGSSRPGPPCESVTSLIANELEAVFAALIGGAKYGMKIRLPHALVMTFLFRQDLSTYDKLKSILKLSLHHATNLATFASLYKLLLTMLKWVSRHLRHSRPDEKKDILKALVRTLLSLIVDGPYWKTPVAPVRANPGHPENPYHSLVAGTISGFVAWREYSTINYQIMLYVASRVVIGLFKKAFLIQPDGKLRSTPPLAYSMVASLAWGLAVCLYEQCPDVLHRSMVTSMNEIYRYGIAPTKHGKVPETNGLHDFVMHGFVHPFHSDDNHGSGYRPQHGRKTPSVSMISPPSNA